ncbi:MAG: PAS domain S-box protein [Geminicoccaceae bacterium]|nr:PAS domain S-box protein [Geminicoccaceae bacterium]
MNGSGERPSFEGLSRALLERLEHAAAVLSPCGRIVAANRRFVQATDLPAAPPRLDELFIDLEADALRETREGRPGRHATLARGAPVELEWRPLGERLDGAALVLLHPVDHDLGAASDPEHFCQGLIENLPGIVFRRILHPDGTITIPYVSPTAERIAGVPDATFRDHPEALKNHLDPEDLPRFQTALEASARSGEPYCVDLRFRRPDGVIRWFRSLGTPRPGVDGSTVFDGIVLDITELKDRQDELAAAEARFRDITLSGSDWIFETDQELRYTYLSERFSEITGIPEAHVIGRRREEIYDADVDGPAWRAHLAVLADRRPYRDQVLYSGKGAGRRWFRTSGVPVYEAGVFKGYRGVASEITAEMRIQERLRESEERFRDIVESSSDWVWEMDADLRFTFLSDRFQQVTDTDPKNVLGHTRGERMERLNEPEIWRRHARDLAARRSFREFRYAYQDDNGRARFQMVSGRPIHDADLEARRPFR